MGDTVNKEIDMKNYQVRTDLLIDLYTGEYDKEKVDLHTEKDQDIEVVDIVIKDEENEFKKKKGKYTTVAFSDVTDKENQKRVEEVVTRYLKAMLDYLHISPDASCLVVGLGNRESTPDSLGPRVIEKVLVTKYLFDAPGIQVSSDYRNVSVFSPGVLATTGIESSEMILGIVERTKPDFLIVIDALASTSLDRINKTIQMTDSGIHPGSGIGNNRKEINQESLGIPVISIGVPTVIEAITVVSDTIQYLYKHFAYNKENLNKNKFIPITKRDYREFSGELNQEEKEELFGHIGLLSEDERKELIFEVLTPIGYNMMVTPKEIDFLMEKLSSVIASSINCSLHKNFDI